MTGMPLAAWLSRQTPARRRQALAGACPGAVATGCAVAGRDRPPGSSIMWKSRQRPANLPSPARGRRVGD